MKFPCDNCNLTWAAKHVFFKPCLYGHSGKCSGSLLEQEFSKTLEATVNHWDSPESDSAFHPTNSGETGLNQDLGN